MKEDWRETWHRIACKFVNARLGSLHGLRSRDNYGRTPNDPKVSDCGAGQEPCGEGSSAGGSTANDTRNSSLDRMVRRFVGVQ